ncbi:flagellar hook-length control protein FliK [Rhizobium sp. L1K21]|uniref:flagellar hook-length control protein FliK n=1 Tax=Rhizobium sp. L1K21 TaxID=2954933 RepID=UPI002092A59D|nr:flagellar hook-length control protein FliK [Rhizobium sp. L1K21]MCO6187111.1 flagellar hook-length control protein FliK [Rhizobium sp. L1K21]
MSRIDQNLLSSTAASNVQYSTSSSARRSAAGDTGFGEVFEKTAVREKRSDYSRDDERRQTSVNDDDRQRSPREASNDDTPKAERAERARDSEADTGAAAKPQDDKASADAGKTDEPDNLKKALADLKNLDEEDIDRLAEKLGVSAEELSAALEELTNAAAEAAPANGGATSAQGETAGTEEDNIAALFRLLLGQKKADGEKTDADKLAGDKTTDGDGETAKADDDSLADDIAELLHALSGNGAMQDNASDQDDDAASGGTTFRFERADGKGVPVEMQIGGLEDGADLETGQNAGKVETVTVLDSRRYLAPADINATNIVGGMTGDKTWTSVLKTVSTAQVPVIPPEKMVAEVNTLKIQMHPQDLGTVTATLKLKGDDLIVNMSVHTAEAYSQLNADKDKIMQSLKSQGFSVDQINIQLTAAPDKVQQSASSQQHQDGQQMQGGANGNAARQEQQDGNRRQQSNGQNSFQPAEDLAKVNADSGNGARGAGQIYL